ncbi:FtsX-like permease family protein [Demequina sp.]|uniref:FtsX-like permease family protein n=1 Tax=Demequina sp. TaxID=2050685 RepID=UPI003A836D48
MREQLRAQWRLSIWTAALVCLAVALAGTAVIARATQAATHELAWDAYAGGGDHSSGITWWTNGLPGDDELADAVGQGNPHTREPGEIEAMITAAREAGYWAQARLYVPVSLSDAVDGSGGPLDDGLTGVFPSEPWDVAIVDGAAPTAGEIAIAGNAAAEFGFSLGEEIRVRPEGSTVSTALTLTAVTAPTVWEPFASYQPHAYATWADALALYEDGGFSQFDGAAGETTQRIYVDVRWQDGAPGFDALPVDQAPASEPMTWRTAYVSWSSTLTAIAGLMALCTLGAAVAIARSQAQARASWVATARVMGARRATVVAASVLQTLAVGVAASIAGIALAYLAVLALLTWERAAHPGSVLAATPSVPVWGAVLVAVLGVAVAAIAAAVPAFWAARTAPVAAMRHVRPLSQQSVSREVDGRWLVVITAVTLGVLGAALVGGVFSLSGLGPVLEVIAWIVLLAVLIVDTVEICRRAVPRVVTRVGRVPRPWAIALSGRAGNRLRQWSAAGAIVALCTAGVMAVLATGVYAFAADMDSVELGARDTAMAWAQQSAFPAASTWLSIVGGLALAVVVAGAVIGAARIAGSSEDAVHAALGLSRADARRASAAEVAVPMGTGAVIGIGIGWTLAAAAHLLLVATPPYGLGEVGYAAALTLGTAVLVGVAVVVPIAAASAVFAAVPTRVSAGDLDKARV